jgi:hypothetical protein
MRMGGIVLERWIVGLLGIWTLALAFLVPGHRVVAWPGLLAGLAVGLTIALVGFGPYGRA